MTPEALGELALRLRRGEATPGVEVLKRNPVRCVARAGEVLLKVPLGPRSRALREARTLREAARRGIPVPEVVVATREWIATRFVEGRPARREDLPGILDLVRAMHGAGMLHGDLHLGNLLVGRDGLCLLDLQRARFWPFVPAWLRRRELGFLAFSLGEPLPPELAAARRWRDRRARSHWRSRTRRCLVESGGFTRFALGSESGFRRRDADAAALRAAVESGDPGALLKSDGRASLRRHGGLVTKRFASAARARAAWLGGHGLEVRGVPAARALGWAGKHLVMEDAGPTLSDWIEAEFERAPAALRDALAESLGALLGRLHRLGIYHRDLKANNLAWEPGTQLRLLDYAGVRFRRRVSRRRRVKNLAQLNAALPDGVPAGFRERAFQRYLAASDFHGGAARLRRDVIRQSLSRDHRWGGCSPSGSTSSPASRCSPP